MKNFIINNLKRIMFALSVVITILLGALIGIVLVYQKGFNQIENLEDIKPKVMTVIHDDKGAPIKEFAIEKRTIVQRGDIPDILVNAIIASEDNQFYSHWGINFKGTFRAIIGIMRGQDRGGGSSITQQLARNLFLTKDRTWQRKLQEMLMAIQIEKKYSKDQIITFYCNKIFLGSSVYGVDAASRYYFGKPLKDMDIAEAALIPTIMPSPNGKYNVFKNPQNCLRKRNYVLLRMLELGFIDKQQYDTAVKAPLPVKPHETEEDDLGDYFVEDTRKQIEAKFGDKRLYTGGLKIYTTLNSQMQGWAQDALRANIRALDKRQGWRGKLENLLKQGKENAVPVYLETEERPIWKSLKLKEGAITEGIVLSVNRQEAIIKIDQYQCILNEKDARWSRYPLHHTLKKGDVALVKILSIPKGALDPLEPETTDFKDNKDNKENKENKENKKTDTPPKKRPMLVVALEQDPKVQGAIMVVDNKTGEIKAMVGGYSFEKSKWNNATQALRQTGSTFKPIIYTAALENGFSPASIIVDEPTIFDNPWTQEPYEPQNHTGDFKGRLTLRRGLQQSRNIISAKLVEHLTPPKVVQYARRFGITSDLRPYMSIALGAFEVTLKEMAAVYTVFPNMGYRVKPYMIKKIIDQNNHIVEENFPDRKKVLEKESAYVMNYLLQGVVQMGTGKRARSLPAPIGGKTGTTDDFTDAWFIGFSPTITVAVWVGFDTKKKLGNEETGSRAACPVFVDFMTKYLEKYPEIQEFRRPPGIVMINIDRYTGKRISPDCLYPFSEAFTTNMEQPLEFCREEDHDEVEGYFGESDDDIDEAVPSRQPQPNSNNEEGEG